MDPDQPGRVKPRPPQACLKAPVTDNPFWWPEIAAAASDPKSFGAHTLPKSSKLPKAGAAIKQGPAALYDVSTLTSTASKSSFELPGISAHIRSSSRPTGSPKLASQRTKPESRSPACATSTAHSTRHHGAMPATLPTIPSGQGSQTSTAGTATARAPFAVEDVQSTSPAQPSVVASFAASQQQTPTGAGRARSAQDTRSRRGSPSRHSSPQSQSPAARGTDRHGTTGHQKMAANGATDDDAEYELTKDVVTSDDVIEFYAKYGQDSPVAFFFCVRCDTLLRFRPYDLLVVRREEVRDEYYTVSATGVTHIRKGMPAEFKPLAEWHRERTLFSLLSNIAFFQHSALQHCFMKWYRAKRCAAFRRIRAAIADRLFHAKPPFIAALMDVAATVSKLSSVDFINTAPHTYHTLQEYSDLQSGQRESKDLVRMVQKQSRLYQESVRTLAELTDTTGVDLCAGQAAVRDRSMVAIRADKVARARTYRRILQEELLLSSFLRLVDYMCSEALIARVVDNADHLLAQLRAPRAVDAEKLPRPTFVSLVDFEEVGMSFVPSEDSVRDMLQNNVIEGVLSAVQASPRILYMRAFAQLFQGRPSGLHIRNIISTSPRYEQLLEDITSTLSEDYATGRDCAKLLEPVRMIHDHQMSWDKQLYAEAVGSDSRQVRLDLRKFRSWKTELDKMKISQVAGCLLIDSKVLKTRLAPVVTDTASDIKDVLTIIARNECLNVAEELQKRNAVLTARPEELDGFMAYRVAHSEQFTERQAALSQMEKVNDMYETLQLNGHKIDHKDDVRRDDMQEAAANFARNLALGKEFIGERLAEQKASLQTGAAALKTECEEIMSDIRSDRYSTFEQDVNVVVEDLRERVDHMKELSRNAERFAHFNEELTMPEEDYSILADARKVVENRHAVWTSYHDFCLSVAQWTTTPLVNGDNKPTLNIESIRQAVEDCNVKVFQLRKHNKDDQVVEELGCILDELKEKLPLLEDVANPAFQPRHWIEIHELLGTLDSFCPVEMERRRRLEDAQATGDTADLSDLEDAFKPFDFNTLLKHDIENHAEKVSGIALKASKEAGLERALESMLSDWDGIAFAVVPYKESGTFVLGGIDEIQALLDDQAVRVAAVRSSPFVGHVATAAEKWTDFVETLQDTLDAWIACQAAWQYLEPIFSSPDIMAQMPEAGEKFGMVDASWRDIMDTASADPSALSAGKSRERLDTLNEANQLLEEIQKRTLSFSCLAAYLEVKRIAFPRFFFLSNDEMLEILSETKDPTRVQPHLKKCFEGIAALDFDDKADVHAMISDEGERVAFTTPVQPRKANGAVEQWLVQVETAMIGNLRGVMSSSVAAYAATPRMKWVLEWPGQAVLAVSGIYWTQAVANALAGGVPGSLQGVADQNSKDLADIVTLVRGKLQRLQRATLSALVVMDVHGRDAAVELASQGIEGQPTAFAWLSQLRLYWEAIDQDSPTDMDVVVRMMSADAPYGYEYLGNSGRLVVTPLTDRCYRTLIGAIHMNLGGAPEGPAGTGKTETTKDLAKALARQCVVFNCSDSLDYITMAKFFKGLAASGAWACFDEFNRIDLEVLSVVAQQVLEVQLAVKARVKTFFFEGSELPLRPTCNAFITMNPGYAGRSELPDNLKALFRTVAMMVPDYAMIAEIMLYSSGYLCARDAARKIVATYRLCSEQLSSQDHYDYGMRAVMAVLRSASNLKTANPDAPELELILRAIVDVNLCKFLSHDVPLFRAILADLFPGVPPPAPDHSNLERAISVRCAEAQLQATEYFMCKTIQLYEMIVVRHGLMVVGQPFSGKSSSLKVLAGALTDLKEAGFEGPLFDKVQTKFINPKSVTMGQLYGESDRATQEWKDGILGLTFRQLASDPCQDRKWCILDGPVDAIWIENMNTVLDDNKKLCLPNSEIIAMSSTMSMIFEVGDLASASPATVSRCGMVYLEPHRLGWEPLLTSWLARMHGIIGKDLCQLFERLFKWQLAAALRFVRREVKELSPTEDSALATTTMRLIESLLDEFRPIEKASSGGAGGGGGDAGANGDVGGGGDGGSGTTMVPGPAHSLDAATKISWVEAVFVFSVVWAVGATGGTEDRTKFDVFFRTLTGGQTPQGYELEVPKAHVKLNTPMMPSSNGATVFDWFFDKTAAEWCLWSRSVPAATIQDDAKFSDIFIPTVDSVRYTFLLDLAIRHHQPFLFVGPTGTGKTIFVRRYLQFALPVTEWTPAFLTLSARTTALNTQEQIDGRLDRRRRGVYGPTPGRRAVVFVDDLNMPSPEVYGAQPPLELLRQGIDGGGWYGRDSAFRQLLDVQFLAAMAPPGGGRAYVTNRFLRHFSSVALTPADGPALATIFQTILDWHLSAQRGYATAERGLSGTVIAATLTVYQSAIAQLLPTPKKSHYVFNLRDFSRVISGFMLAPPSTFSEGEGTAVDRVRRLWLHEVMRVFGDRLTDLGDQEWLLRTAKQALTDDMSTNMDALLEHLNGGAATSMSHIRRLFFTDIMDVDNEPQDRRYSEQVDISAMISQMDAYLVDHNGVSKRPMNLAMFLFALEHVARICRVLRQPGAHALLVGVGGSGRQSLARLAAFVNSMSVFQVEISKNYGKAEWREDLKMMLRKAGVDGTPCMFLFADTQIKDEAFVEDINNILNAGEVPNMFPNDERQQILEAVRPAASKRGLETPSELWSFFVEQCRLQLHIALCFSPGSDVFRERLRANPSLVNCCTIDWFHAWPEDALEAVADKFLRESDLQEAERKTIVSMCQHIHQQAQEASENFYTELRRRNYVTPTSFLELIQMFQKVLASKRARNRQMCTRYVVGLEKLQASAAAVANMQNELTDLQPQLVKTVGEVEELMVRIGKEKAEVVEPKAEVVKIEEAKVQEKADAAKAIKDECEAELSVAMPILQDALSALDTIKEADVGYIRKLGNPPGAIKLVMEAVCVILGVKPAKGKDESGKAFDDWWKPSVVLLNEKDFLQKLKSYDKDNIPPKIIEVIRKKYTNDPAFTPEVAKKASGAAEGMCKWVHAMDKYENVAKVVAPKQAKLKEAEGQYEEVMIGLRKLQADLQVLMDKLAAMEADLFSNTEKKNHLEAEVELCSVKLDRAQKLIGGLGGERDRWSATADALEAAYGALTGDALVAATTMSYFGAFTANFRQHSIDVISQAIRGTTIKLSADYSLSGKLTDAVTIRGWLAAGLPNDSFSIENAVMATSARRWPLAIDPQGQANSWIKAMEKSHNLQVIKATVGGGGDLARTLENAVPFGLPVLLEDVREELDPSLEPLLLKQVFKQGGVPCIRLGDATVEYSNDFKFYMTTKLRNPHYLPEVAVKVTLLNFMITPGGLEDQLLGVVIAAERPDLEEQRSALVAQGAENARRLADIEDRILEVLSSSEGNILDDATAVATITEAKATANDIAEKQALASGTERDIEAARVEYKPCGTYTSTLFFCISDLAVLDPMYQYSLPWFIALFLSSIAAAETADIMTDRLRAINAHFTYSLYCNICRSLFERDKLLFSFLLTSRVLDARGDLDAQEWTFLLTGGLRDPPNKPPNPAPEWLQDRAWKELRRLSRIPAFAGLDNNFMTAPGPWRTVHDASEPHLQAFPAHYIKLSSVQKLLIVRVLRPDRVMPAVRDFVAEHMGNRFVTPPPFQLAACYADSSSTAPLVFVLSAGSDPTATLLQFASEREMDNRLHAISLGQGQGPKAAKLIEEAVTAGGWVVLQNCHLAPSWMPGLERICDGLRPESTHPDFRLWMTSYPSPAFPVSVLQNGVKMTTEPPKGVTANMRRSFTLEPASQDEFFEGCVRPAAFKRMLFGLVLFHAVVQERRKFGPLGWNIPYGFDDGDWRISVRQLRKFIDDAGEGGETPFSALQYVTGECNYGGRVTDDKDRRLLSSLLEKVYSTGLVDTDEYKFSESGTFKSNWTAESTHTEMMDYLASLPLTPAPEVFGLHANADITKDQNDTAALFASLLKCGGGSGGGGTGGDESHVGAVVTQCIASLPPDFDTEAVQRKYPVLYEESMNTVLTQEMVRFNRLLVVIKSSLKSIDLAIKGLLIMSSDLEAAYNSLAMNTIPAMWAKASYPSMKPLGSYLEDLYRRLKMLSDWYTAGQPSVFWLSGFFFVQSFLTAALQNFARKRQIPIDMIGYHHNMLQEDETDLTEKPEEGVYVYGLFMEGCGWDKEQQKLCESSPRVLFTKAPCMWLQPFETSQLPVAETYSCPVYRTAERRGTLATTGHSTNFVMFVNMPTDESSSHWTMRGVAMLSQLSD